MLAVVGFRFDIHARAREHEIDIAYRRVFNRLARIPKRVIDRRIAERDLVFHLKSRFAQLFGNIEILRQPHHLPRAATRQQVRVVSPVGVQRAVQSARGERLSLLER